MLNMTAPFLRTLSVKTLRSGRPVSGLAAASRSIVVATLALVVAPAVAAEKQVVEIASKTGVHAFSVEMATNDQERATGLMYRKELPLGQGMLFDFKDEQPVSMWMRNTYVSLDMIFIRNDGRIANIAENTETLSEKIIPSRGPVRAVLEVVAGTAKKFGIAAGDKIAHPMFNAR
jgi:uncharacterized membrane protein (UPF0127 family)